MYREEKFPKISLYGSWFLTIYMVCEKNGERHTSPVILIQSKVDRCSEKYEVIADALDNRFRFSPPKTLQQIKADVLSQDSGGKGDAIQKHTITEGLTAYVYCHKKTRKKQK